MKIQLLKRWMIYCLAIIILLSLAYVCDAERTSQIDNYALGSGTEKVVQEISKNGFENRGILTLHGAKIEEAHTGKAFRINKGGWAEYSTTNKISSDGGSISFWIKPNWPENYKKSNTLLSMFWNDGRKGYMALSQGWWEPTGAERLYFVLNNQEYLHCSVQSKLVPEHWTHLVATWQNGKNGNCRIYIDGDKVAEQNKSYYASYTSVSPLIIGSDRATTEKKGRGADALISKLYIYDRSLTSYEVKSIFQEQHIHHGSIEQKKSQWLQDGMKLPLKMKRADDGTILETRAIFDEDISWATSRSATDLILSRVKRAGFNVYIPCVWHGNTAYFNSRIADVDLRLKKRIDSGDDPLAYLITKAHSLGIEVHPWFTVVKRSTSRYPAFFDNGTPNDAFNVHNDEFKRFITDLMLDVVRRYDVDGINLDYIRAMGVCSSAACRADYLQRSGYEFWPDYALRVMNGKARDRLQQWQDNAVTKIVANFSTAAKAIKPDLVISVDGHPLPKGVTRPLEGKDEVLWANMGLVDIIFAMDYRECIDFENIDKVRADLNEPNKLVVLFGNYDKHENRVTPRSGKLVNSYVEYARRKWPESGIAFYLYGQMSDEQVNYLNNGGFIEKAARVIR